MRAFDTVIIGAGPAGLSAAAELAGQGRCLLLEQGATAGGRDRGVATDLVSGVGGAGLFSDGKHSFFPSATALWGLPDRPALEQSFAATAALLARFGVDAGRFPEAMAPAEVTPGVWQPKPYPSIYVGLEARHRLIDELWRSAGERWSGARVVDAERAGGEIALTVERGGERQRLAAGRLILATGRWSPAPIRPWLERLGASYRFASVEFGVRLETEAKSPLFARLPGVDGKLRLVDGDGEVRTFCTCRDGEVVLGAAFGWRAYSGRADGPATGRSNVGLVLRSADAALAAEVTAALAGTTPDCFPLAEWRGPERIARHFGERGARALTTALGRFLAPFPELAREPVRVYAPVLERVGDYPRDDGGLRLAEGVWIAGDAGGRFRGIVAAMISGRYVARRIIQR